MRFPVWRISVFIAAAVWPLFWLYEALMNSLGPDPGKVLVDRLAGDADPVVDHLEHDAVAEIDGVGGVDCSQASVGVVVLCLCGAAFKRVCGVHIGVRLVAVGRRVE